MTSKKLFTPQEATRTLPLVRRIVDDILSAGQGMRRIGTRPEPSPEDVDEYNRLTDSLKALFEELEALGCSYKGWNFSVGLVDFPAVIDGKEVLLCWRSDEPAIEHFHRYQDGYAGRRSIPRSLLQNVDSESELPSA